MTAPLRIGIAGALGRMGRAIAAALDGRPDATVTVGFDRPGTGRPNLAGVHARRAAGRDVVRRDHRLHHADGLGGAGGGGGGGAAGRRW